MAASATSAQSNADKTEAASAPSTKGGGGGGSRLVLALTGVNLIITLAIVSVLLISFQKERKSASVGDISASEHSAGDAAKEGEHGAAAKGGEGSEAAKPSTDFGKMIALEQFIVNLSTPGSATPKFVRVNISIEVGTTDSETEVTSKMPQVRNVIIDLFNSKHPSDLASAEGRDYLKEQIRNALNGFMVTGKIKGVFFTNFHLTS